MLVASRPSRLRLALGLTPAFVAAEPNPRSTARVRPTKIIAPRRKTALEV